MNAINGKEMMELGSFSLMPSSSRACAWSPDSKFIASTSLRHTLFIWDAINGDEVMRLIGHSDTVNSCVWSPDGKFIASAANDNTMCIWDAQTGQLIRIHALGNPNCIKDRKGDPGYAVLEPITKKIIEAKGEIWRNLNWITKDRYTRLPAEIFGHLPGLEVSRKA